MDSTGAILVASIVLPLVGAGMCYGMTRAGREVVRKVALAFTLLALVLAALVVSQAPRAVDPQPREVEGVAPDEFAVVDLSWGGAGEKTGQPAAFDVRFSLGLDGLSVWLYGLSALLLVTSVLVSWEQIDDRANEFYALLLLLETGVLGVFAARDLLLFYVFFEFTLIPLFFLIGVWGSEQRHYAAMKFFLYTLAGSLLTFLGLLAIVLWDYSQTGRITFSILALKQGLAAHPMSAGLQYWIFLALFAGFAIKVPLFPLHTWLPLAHVQAPTAGSVLLAGILLKIGAYGFIRFSLPMLPDATIHCAPFVLWIALIGIIYGALVALSQSDMKKLIAYSSVSHLGFCMLGIFAFNALGMQGGVLQLVNHGLSTGGLFALVGMLYERYHTREIAQMGGLAKRLPIFAFFLVLFTLSSIGLPGLNGFAGELLLLIGMFQRGMAPGPHGTQLLWIAVLSVTGVVLGAWYMLYLVQRTMFGPLREPRPAHGAPEHSHAPVRDLSRREVYALLPLVVFIVWIGVQPSFFLTRTSRTLDPLASSLDRRVGTAHHVSVVDVPSNNTGGLTSTARHDEISASGGPHGP
ncbi:MAG: NADH-quinone oxidoreductase subunit M [Planctomycetia bacterium]|nr:NADH-quinone oxidoreductase subunit M [Planctomycetia bacterium]